ncbi:MAG: SDR family NAD(P)-dependent oxidoreductase [Planctomycetota bacterium]|nr:SDR family NAD(P)-dependent oxidoreductase [Planctomycetota bacterium]
MKLNLSEHVVVVTGGASGIGRAVAAGFLDEHSKVAIWDVSEAVEITVAELNTSGSGEAIGIRVDVCESESIRDAIEKTESLFGPIQHVVHAAAIGSGKFGAPFTNLKPSDWPRVLDVNIMGMVNVAHAVATGMQARREGTLICIASVAGQIGSPTDPPYSASKAANINFAQCMAKDLAPFDIRVNTVCPGMVQTPLNKSVWHAWNEEQSPRNQRSYEDWAGEKIRNVVPLGRWQAPEDIADMCVFLSSDRAKNVTGQTINVDGGFVMHW